MVRLAPMAGRWAGEGWVRMGPGEPERFKGTETVASQLGGHILVVEGKHMAATDGRLVHHAYAVISHDAVAGTYRFRSHLANGRGGDYKGEWKDEAFVWSMEVPRLGTLRYTIRFQAGVWDEIGEMQREGAWVKFFEMHMKRLGN
ncbi:MAG: hypothetical protein IPI84_13250 [Holophagaceae bacterium]|nr:hypothetical protein [Holophagaceae bacterium]